MAFASPTGGNEGMEGMYDTKTYPVDRFSRPGGNLTGVSVLASVLGPKRSLELLLEIKSPGLPHRLSASLNSGEPNRTAHTRDFPSAATEDVAGHCRQQSLLTLPPHGSGPLRYAQPILCRHSPCPRRPGRECRDDGLGGTSEPLPGGATADALLVHARAVEQQRQ